MIKPASNFFGPSSTRLLLALFILSAAFLARAADPAASQHPWKSLFNGKDLSGWQVNDFAGAGEVKLENGRIIIGTGAALTGIRRTNDFLKINYEVDIQAMKIEGDDFFCGLTFPVKDSHATLIVGGWGGSLVGVSSIDGMDASENEYTQYMRFDNNKWYDIRLRVTEKKIQAWVNGEKLIDASIEGRRISMRAGEIEDSVPFGIATYQTTAAIRSIQIRSVPAHITKIAFIAGKKSHGPGEHEYKKALELLSKTLEQRYEFIDTKVHFDGWPTEQESLSDADSIVIYCDGADHGEINYPMLLGNRPKFLDQQMDRGAGLVLLHYAVIAPKAKSDLFFKWVGGYFDYETGDAPNHWYSKIENREFTVYPAAPSHPVCQGLMPFSIKEEFYFKMRFAPDHKNITPILTFDPEKKDWDKVVSWSIEQPNGHRGFACTGGHYFKNFEDPNMQKLLLNAILWTARASPPPKIDTAQK